MNALRQCLSGLRARVSLGRTPFQDARTRRRRSFGVVAATALAVAALGAGPAATDSQDRDTHWVGTWSASPQPAGAPVQINGQTVRQIVHTSLGGERVRVRLSNAYGSTALRIGSAHVALSAGGLSIVEGTDRVLRFNGSATISIPAGALVISDPVTLDLQALGDLAVSLFLPDHVTVATEHTVAIQTTYVSGAGDFTDASAFEATTTQSYYFLSGVEVSAAKRARAVVAVGDSLTVGFGSTPDLNRRWPNLLAERFQSHPATSHLGVLNAGVIGNRILHDIVGTGALARFDRDVLVQPGVGFVIVLQGNADILIPRLTGNPSEVVTVEEIIQGHRQMIEHAHALGLKILGCTLNPVEGYPFPGFWTPDLEQKRQSVNRWIRTGGAYDGVIDFDLLLRDPSHPSRLLPAYDSGDHVHPNDQGYQAMADAVDLSMFRDGDQR